MKRLTSLLLMLCCMIGFSSYAMAEAKMSTTQKTLITSEGDWSGYFFAKVENSGDKGAYIDFGGKLVGFDADDNIILSESYVCAYPAGLYLEPGEYAYVYEHILNTDLETSTIADYKFSIGASDYGSDYDTLPCEAKLEYVGGDSYENYIYVTFTNTTDEVIDDFAVTAAIFDQDENLICVSSDSMSSIGVHPNSTITLRLYIDSDLAEYYDREKLVPTTVDALLYVQK